MSTICFCNPRRGKSPPPSPAAAMAKPLLRMNDKNLKYIHSACSGNLELQTLVMSTIDDYKQGTLVRTEDVGGAQTLVGVGGLCSELVRRRHSRGKRPAPGDAQAAHARAGGAHSPAGEGFIDGPGFKIAADHKPLTAHQKLYKNWSVKMFLELFQYVEASVFTRAQKAIDSKNVCRIMFTRGMGLECGAVDESESDKSTTTDYAECFEALRQLYIMSGRVFRQLSIINGSVNTNDPVLAMYELRVVTGPARAESPGDDVEFQVLDKSMWHSTAAQVPWHYVSDKSPRAKLVNTPQMLMSASRGGAKSPAAEGDAGAESEAEKAESDGEDEPYEGEEEEEEEQEKEDKDD